MYYLLLSLQSDVIYGYMEGEVGGGVGDDRTYGRTYDHL